MKRSALGIVVLALAAWGFAGVSSSVAGHCSGTASIPESPHDSFGSCEDGGTTTFGNVSCGATQTNITRVDVPNAGSVLVRNGGGSTGVQICNDGTQGDIPVEGRITVVNTPSGTTVASDGDRDNPHTAAQSWTRLDASPGSSNCDLRQRRGASGDYWSAQNNNGAGQPLLADNCIIP